MENYSKRELDRFFKDNSDSNTRLENKIDKGFEGVHKRQDLANGKVKKIIIALIATVFFVMGLAGKGLLPILLKLLL